MKKIFLIIFLSLSIVTQTTSYTLLQEDFLYPRYTIYIPNNPNEMIIYFNCHGNTYPTGLKNNTTSKTKYNYQEDAIYEIASDNPNAIIVTALWSNHKWYLDTEVEELINQYEINNIVISGWSVGGNDALIFANKLINDGIESNINILLIDCNHTNSVKSNILENVIANINNIYYLSNNINKSKINKSSNIASKTDMIYLKCDLNNKNISSNHMGCRNSAFEDGIYRYILREEEFESNISIVKLIK